jgi:hypothetical protein
MSGRGFTNHVLLILFLDCLAKVQVVEVQNDNALTGGAQK